MEQSVAQWWSMASAFFAAPAALLTGSVQLTTILPTAGLALAVVGLVLAIRWRERQALWVILPAILTLLAPFVTGLADTMMGPFGVFFTLFAGAIGLLIWIGVLASDAQKRLPIWLIGLGCFSFIAYFALVAVALTWG